MTAATPPSAAGRSAASRRAPGGARRLRIHRRPDGPVPGPEHRDDALCRSSSACGTGTTGAGPEEFLGLANFEELLTDDLFHIAIRNTLYYTVIWVPLTMAIGLFLRRRSSTRRSAARRSSGQRSTSRPSRAPRPSRSSGSSCSSLTGCSTRSGRARDEPALRGARLRSEPQLVRLLPDRDELRHRPECLDDVRARSCSSTWHRCSRSATRSTRRRRSTAPGRGRRSGASPSRCSSRVTSSSPPSAVIGGLQLFDQALIARQLQRRPAVRPDDRRAVSLQRRLRPSSTPDTRPRSASCCSSSIFTLDADPAPVVRQHRRPS